MLKYTGKLKHEQSGHGQLSKSKNSEMLATYENSSQLSLNFKGQNELSKLEYTGSIQGADIKAP